MDIILASTSPYRRVLLERLKLQFRCFSPDVVETQLPDEQPEAMAQRLALFKARSVAAKYSGALVIGSDQVAVTDGCILGKPGNFDSAVRQLQTSSGRVVNFYTAVALICGDRNVERFHVEPYAVKFRQLSDVQIANYVLEEQPYDCAGSFKVEGLGISLFDRLWGGDPTGLEGLPLIALTRLLAESGVDVLDNPAAKKRD